MSNKTELIAAILAELSDTANARWAADEITAHLRRALRAYNRADPRRLAATIEGMAGQREYDLATDCPDLVAVLDVWYPYDPADPAWPPERPAWSMLLPGTLALEVADAPSGDAAAQLRVFYAAPHTIEDLDGAEATTLDGQGEQALILAASAYAAHQYAQALISAVTVSAWTPQQFMAWAAQQRAAYHALLDEILAQRRAATDARVTWAGEV
ncbi:MAG: hypothetical protein V1772_09465 [Chloroflexota bacterium]